MGRWPEYFGSQIFRNPAQPIFEKYQKLIKESMVDLNITEIEEVGLLCISLWDNGLFKSLDFPLTFLLLNKSSLNLSIVPMFDDEKSYFISWRKFNGLQKPSSFRKWARRLDGF